MSASFRDRIAQWRESLQGLADREYIPAFMLGGAWVGFWTALRHMGRGDPVAQYALAVVGGLILGACMGTRYFFKRRNPVVNEQSPLKLAFLISLFWGLVLIVVWVVAESITDTLILALIVFVVLYMSLPLAILGGFLFKLADWYPLQRSRGSVIRFGALYTLALGLTYAAYTWRDWGVFPAWSLLYLLTVAFVIWLTVAFLWKPPAHDDQAVA